MCKVNLSNNLRLTLSGETGILSLSGARRGVQKVTSCMPYRKIRKDVELHKVQRCERAGERPCAVCRGSLLQLIAADALAFYQTTDQDEPGRKTGRAREIDWLNALYRLQDSRG